MKHIAVLIAAIGLFALTALAIVTMLDIAGRELFGIPIDGFSDIADMIVVFAAASCFPISLIERHHVSVRFLGKLTGASASCSTCSATRSYWRCLC